MSDRSKPIPEAGQNSFFGGCSTLLTWLFCKGFPLVGKGEHRFPPVSDLDSDRFIKVSPDHASYAEELIEGKILFTPGHTADSLSLKVGNIILAMNGFPSRHNITIWVEEPDAFGTSWKVLQAAGARLLYPAHGKPFSPDKLAKNSRYISEMRLRPLQKNA